MKLTIKPFNGSLGELFLEDMLEREGFDLLCNILVYALDFRLTVVNLKQFWRFSKTENSSV